MQQVRIIALVLATGLGFGLAAARAQAPSPAATTASSTASPAPGYDEAAAELQEHHRHHHHGGVTRFITMSLDTLGADEAKRPQIEKIKAELESQMAPARDAEKELLETIATGVAAGNVDQAKVDAAIAKVAAASEAAHGASLEALNKLHAVLSPVERAALADKVQAHWEVWHQVNSEPQSAREPSGHLANMTKRLSLTSEQVNKIEASLKTAMAGLSTNFDPKAAEAHVSAFCTAFASDSFDAKTLTTNTAGRIAGLGEKRTAVFYETVTPLITPDQRTKLAEHLREHTSHEAAASGK